MAANVRSRSSKGWALRIAAIGLTLASALSGHPAAAQPLVATANFSLPSRAIQNRAWNVPVGATLRLTQVPLEAQAATLVLERFEVWTPDARVRVEGEGATKFVAPPRRAYFRGQVADDPDSFAFLAVGTKGAEIGIRGLVASEGKTYVLGNPGDLPAPGEPLVVSRVDELARQRDWRCGAEGFVPPAGAFDFASGLDASAAPVGNATAAQYSIKVAIETDAEFYALFNSVDRAAGYIGDLMGAISSIYNRDVRTSLRINFVSLWSGGAASDPWTAATTDGALCELGGYWAANRPQATYPRATTHLLSGKNLGGGVAWVGVLCAGNFSSQFCPTGLGGGYGMTANIAGNFNPTSGAVVWDIEAVSHEIGHNFSSPHSHCYNNIPTSGLSSVDQCYGAESGCYSGATSLPAGGKGSIMSYCHLLSGGLANNIALSFGAAGLYGNQSERIPQKMRSYVAALAPSCRSLVKSPPGDMNGDGRSEPNIYRNGAWLAFPFWPSR